MSQAYDNLSFTDRDQTFVRGDTLACVQRDERVSAATQWPDRRNDHGAPRLESDGSRGRD